MRLAATLAISFIVVGSVVQAQPLVQLEGTLHAVERPGPGIGAAVGSFLVESAGSGDLRATPGALSLATDTGSIAGMATSSAAVRNVDPSTGRLRPAGETGSCVTGAEPACLSIVSNLADDGSLAFAEDFDGDGRRDRGEDFNGNGVLDPGEDQDFDAALDVNEDLDGDGFFQSGPTPLQGGTGEDIDLDGHFDVGELNANGDTTSDDSLDANGNEMIDAFEIGDTDGDGFVESGPIDPESRMTMREQHAGSVPVWDAICDTSKGFTTNDTRVCGLTIWNSKTDVLQRGSQTDIDARRRKAAASIASLLSNALTGNGAAVTRLRISFTAGAPIPLVRLNQDPGDDLGGRAPTSFTQATTPRMSLNQVLSNEQEGELGCGLFFGTDCEADGIDFLFSEASVLLESIPGVAGDYGECNGLDSYCIGCDVNGNAPGSPNYDATRILPVAGTLPFKGGLPGSRYVDGRLVQLPGARGLYKRNGDINPSYNPLQDGCTGPAPAGCESATALTIPVVDTGAPVTSPLYQPYDFGAAAGLPFRSEMAALSWNFMLTLVATGTADPDAPAADELDPNDPMRIGAGLCSFAQPHQCRAVKNLMVQLRSDDPRDVPLLRWDWESSLSFEITTATRDLAAFAGGTAHVIGPEVVVGRGDDLGVSFILEPPAGMTPPLSALVGPFGPGPDQIPGNEDDAGRRYGFAVPEASAGTAAVVSMATLAAVSRRRARVI